ncbi:restriction endonuclease PLD domain-containing protein [Mycoplasma wenyonii]|uniref:restriction endonuclease PLD domain-containing protein n=1 Tax=Mycoplasma wenyonii TaxID=65123 RepID=UPI0002E9323C|nr:restriction endonuclease PLD domain-containing protein [Mycoplasma wenyonii]
MEENYLLFTALKQISIGENQKTIVDCFLEQIKESDRLDIVVGYCSKASLEKLDELINQTGIKNVCLILGMYYLEGFPKTIYEKVVELNEKWIKEGVGEIRLTHSFKDHNKLYCFYKDEQPISAILGTANLSFLEGQGMKQKQFEMATLFKNKAILEQISFHISQMKTSSFSENIIFFRKHLLFIREITDSGRWARDIGGWRGN